MLVLFVHAIALPLKLDIADDEYQPCEGYDTFCRHQILRQDDPSDVKILPSPSPNGEWFQFVDFYAESPNPKADK